MLEICKKTVTHNLNVLEYTQVMRIKKPGILFSIALLLIAASGLHGQELPKRTVGTVPVTEYIAAILKNDAKLESKKLALKAASARLEALEHPSFAVASAGTGVAQFSGETKTSPARLETGPWAEVKLGGEFDTVIKASVINSIPLDQGISTLKPAISITQPLNQVLFRQTDLAVLKARNAVTDARQAIVKRETECTVAILEALRDWAMAQNELVQKTSAYLSAREALQTAISLKTYKAGSAALSRLENTLTLSTVAKERSERAGRRKAEIVALLTGMVPQEFAPQAPEPANPDKYLIPENNMAARDALTALSFARISYEQTWAKPSPLLSAYGNLGYGISYADGASTDAEGAGNGLEGEIGVNFSYRTIGASASVGWNDRTDSPYAGISFSWKDTNSAAETQNGLAAATDLRIAEIIYANSLNEAKTAIDDFFLESRLEALDSVRLAAALKDASYGLAETKDLFSAGLATQSDVDESTLAYFTAQANVEAAAWARAIRFAKVPGAWAIAGMEETGVSNEN